MNGRNDRETAPKAASAGIRGQSDVAELRVRRRILAVLTLSLVMVVVNVSSLNVALPSIVRGVGASQTDQLWIVDSYALVFACLLLPMGALGDRYGRQRMLTLGLALFAVGTLLAALSDTAIELIGFRAVMGVAAALIMPATLSIITIVFPPEERAGAIATWAGFAASGAAFGPPMAGLLLEYFWWGSVFLVNLPIAIVILVLTIRVVPDSRDDHHPIDGLGAVLASAGLGALIFAIIEGPEQGWTSTLVVAGFAVAAVALAAFFAWELRVDHPMLDPRLFRIPAFAAGSATIGIAFMVMFAMFLLLSLYMQLVKGWSPLRAGSAMIPFAFVMMFTAPRSPELVARFGIVRVVTASESACVTTPPCPSRLWLAPRWRRSLR